MKVGTLKNILSRHPDDMEIVLSQDPEGNGFYPLEYIEENLGRRDPYDGWEVIHPEDVKEFKNVLVIWP